MARQHIFPRLMRRFAMKGTRGDLLVCAQLLRSAPGDEHRKLLLSAFEEAFKGRAMPLLPAELIDALAQAGSLVLRVRRQEPEAIDEALKLIVDKSVKAEERLLLVRAFGEVSEPRVPALLAVARSQANLDLRKAALASLSRYDDATVGTEIAAAYAELPKPLQVAAQGLCQPA